MFIKRDLTKVISWRCKANASFGYYRTKTIWQKHFSQANFQKIITGLFYVNTKQENFLTLLNVVDEPLATLPESKVRPPKEVLDEVMQGLM